MKLSVRLQTYNHEKYIGECLNSIDKQVTDFPFEVIIGDDFSTDRNTKIIKDFIKNRAKNININYVLLNRQKGDDYDIKRQEKGRLYNFIDILNHCQGKYIALCDGDDYWTDPLKLQKQVDFLEENEEYVIHACNTSVINEKSEIINEKLNPLDTQSFSVDDFLNGKNQISTLTSMFRNILNEDDYTTFLSAKPPFGDWFLWIMLLNKTKQKAFYLNEVVASYRVHVGGVVSLTPRSESLKKEILLHEIFKIEFPKFKNKIEDVLLIRREELIRLQIKESRISGIKAFVKYYPSKLSIRDFLYLLRN